MTANIPAPAAAKRGEVSLWPFVSMLIICVLLGLLIARTHLLVSLTNDHQGLPLLTDSVLHPGDSTSGSLTLGNQGIAPVDYSLSVQGMNGNPPPSQADVTITSAGSTVYSGKLPYSAVVLGTLRPGDSKTLRVTITVPPSAGTANTVIPLDVNFVWSAHPALVWDAWWIWGAAIVVIAAVAGVAVWLRRQSQP